MYSIEDLAYDGLQAVSIAVENGLAVILSVQKDELKTLEDYLVGRKKPVSGQVKANGEIGYMPSEAPVYEDMKVTEWLVYMGMLKGLTKEKAIQQAEELLGEYELEELSHRYLGNLEEADRRLAVLAQTMMGEPEVIILGYPTENISEEAKEKLLSGILKMKEKFPILALGMDPGFAAENADALYLLHEGEIKMVSGETLQEDYPELYGALKEEQLREEDDLSQILADYEGGSKK